MSRALLILFLAASVHAETLFTLSEDRVDKTGNYAATVHLKTTDSVASFQFDIPLGPITYVSALLDSSLSSSGKILSANVLPDNVLRVVVFGLNQTPIPSGPLVHLTFDTQAVKQSLLQLSNVTASDPLGSSVTSNATMEFDGWVLKRANLNGEPVYRWEDTSTFEYRRIYAQTITRTPEHQALVERLGEVAPGDNTYSQTVNQGVMGSIPLRYKISDTEFAETSDINEIQEILSSRALQKGSVSK